MTKILLLLAAICPLGGCAGGPVSDWFMGTTIFFEYMAPHQYVVCRSVNNGETVTVSPREAERICEK